MRTNRHTRTQKFSFLNRRKSIPIFCCRRRTTPPKKNRIHHVSHPLRAHHNCHLWSRFCVAPHPLCHRAASHPRLSRGSSACSSRRRHSVSTTRCAEETVL
ncbi:hypothetical protein, unlikely [Trypanosoma brucei gambiense DAL972]|uniref:Uncharacterized protein n=1 Tax=Trypanosoma brucei gambiense (strain MHOM/CI/86/DAL972) TaxID=679716 RepID=D0A2S6_TRYB9|nr:hypothetical protein, unlikely [Trypanosoma brucei gambiense DAL972]CBH15570.1 hypothetical protein, unlikely [Trypanosoma brucei gambiense DAL972]|eukprot:XP_011777834.1 hypothetical protein, unlikely [Trypanosoma brucei gambiense DAL972]